MGLTLTSLAEAVGATKSYLSMIENERVSNPPSPAILRRVERVLEFSEGELLRTADWQNTPEEIRHAYQANAKRSHDGVELARRLRTLMKSHQGETNNLDRMFAKGELHELVDAVLEEGGSIGTSLPIRYRVPVINRVAAGYPSDFTDLGYPARIADDYVDCPEMNDPDAFAARVVGDSMQPDYKEGDVVVFSPARDLENGCDCFVRIEPDHQTTFKRIFFEGDHQQWVRLVPLNPRYPPRTLPREQVAGLYRAVWRLQQL